MDNPDNVIVTPWKIEEVPLDHWFKPPGPNFEPCKITRVGRDCVYLQADRVGLDALAKYYDHSEHPVGDKANWQRCGHIEQRGVVWVGRDDLYFRRDTAVVNGVRYAVDGACTVSVSVNDQASTKSVYPYLATNKTGRALVTRDGRYSCGRYIESGIDVVPAIRMEAK